MVRSRSLVVLSICSAVACDDARCHCYVCVVTHLNTLSVYREVVFDIFFLEAYNRSICICICICIYIYIYTNHVF